MRDDGQLRRAAGVLLLLAITGTTVSADDQTRARLDEMKQLIKPLRPYRFVDEHPAPVNVSPEPMLRWTDPTRTNRDGSLWAIGGPGRPLAVLTLEFYPKHPLGQVWVFEFSSLSIGRIEIDAGDGFAGAGANKTVRKEGDRLIWSPKAPGVVFHEMADAPVPAGSEGKRLRQIKELAARFTADEFLAPAKQTYVLRVSPHPIHRYHDQAGGVADGAIFEIAHETNPEVLLVIEAQTSATSSTVWRWTAAPLTTAAPTVRLDGRPVWSLPTATPATPRETYVGMIKVRTQQDP